jgi:hypothetical protein
MIKKAFNSIYLLENATDLVSLDWKEYIKTNLKSLKRKYETINLLR